MKEITRHYTNGEVTIIWKPHVCIHSAICFNGLPGVFDPRVRPWIKPEGSDTAGIINQVKKCPSGALTYELNKEEAEDNNTNQAGRIEVLKKGPLMVKGTFILVDDTGKEELKTGNIALCRCGGSNSKPFCDGSHRSNNVL